MRQGLGRGLQGKRKAKAPRGLVESLAGAEQRYQVTALGQPMTRIGVRRRRPRLLQQYIEAAGEVLLGSQPEKVLESWLIQAGHTYQAQVPLLGGRVVGGAVVDFVVYSLIPGEVVILRIQDTFTHKGREAIDEEQMRRLLEEGYQVIDLWTEALYQAVRLGDVGGYVYEAVMRQQL